MGKLKTIGDLITPEGVFTDGDWIESKDQDPSGGVRLIQLADIGDGAFINKSSRFMTEAKAEKLKCTYLQKGDILVARMPDPIGRACIFPGLDQKAVTVVDVCVIRPNNSEVHPPFLKFLINNDIFRREINRHVTGTTRKRISRKNLNQIEFDLPSIGDQKRIAKIFADSEKLISKRKESISLLEKFLKSTFLEMFGDPVFNDKGWKTDVLENLTLKIGSGSTPRGGKESYKTVGISLIRSLNVHDYRFKVKNLARIDNDQAEKLKNVIVNSGDVLFNITGASVCRCTVVPDSILPARVNQHVSIIRVKDSKLNPNFLNYLLCSDNFKKHLIRIATIGGATREAITKDQLEKLEIIVPSPKAQKQFAEIVDKVLLLKKVAYKSFDELVELNRTIQKRILNPKKGDEIDISNILIQETRAFSTDKVETPETFEEQLNKEVEKFSPKKKDPKREKIDISKMTYLDFIGMPEEIQMENYASDYSIETDFVEEELFWQFFLKGRYKKEPFDLDQVEADFNEYFIPKGKDFEYEVYKKHLFKFIEVNPPIVDQYFDENDNRIKLRLTDEAFKA
ncbi:restriction endonuclease subunit S [Aquimarina sp. AU474]|uniref:restriction endonuclease subunit S n=1 Tax=Aquimarina sp. AU474 TaxID=2108529 RepID=UPI000D69DBEA|nr:restriction endonuclease subunit S [Aquimarina sp. AU474]